ncbi:UDP-N-acetylglucosamine 2-epimerase [Aquirufa nivalisilvae]
MKIGILTSSRADYGIYLPLLEKLKLDSDIELEIIAFGTHLSKSHGFTIVDILKNNYLKIHQITSLVSDDSEESIVTSYGLTILKFSKFWEEHKYDLVFCLGDRFEMNAAIQAGIPFRVRFAHLHGGESTLGAIDNVYRHQITIASQLHFTAADVFSEKVIELIGTSKNVYTVGSLSLDGIETFHPIEKSVFYRKFNLPNADFILATFHPETIDIESNVNFAEEMRKALFEISSKLMIVITMPNADTLGSVFRDEILKLKETIPQKIICIENFGKQNYFSAMHYSKLLLGNTSSGILEAASFGKYVVNVGNRQKGRLQSQNVINTKFEKNEMIEAVEKALGKKDFKGQNVYRKSGTANKIIQIVKLYNETI